MLSLGSSKSSVLDLISTVANKLSGIKATIIKSGITIIYSVIPSERDPDGLIQVRPKAILAGLRLCRASAKLDPRAIYPSAFISDPHC